MAENYGWLPQIDTGALFKMGMGIANRQRFNDIKGQLANFNGDYDAAAQQLMRMGLVDEATRLYTAGQLAKYRDVQGQVALDRAGPSLEEKLLAPYLQGNQGPMYLGPDTGAAADAAEEAEASGTTVPGISTYAPRRDLRNAPKKVQDILAPSQDIKQWEKESEAAGTREGFRAGLKENSPAVQSLIDNLVTQVREADNTTLENAIGPLQGAPDPESWLDMLRSGGAQFGGSILNYLEQGAKEGFIGGEGGNLHIKEPDELGGGNTWTTRSKINATQASLIGVMQRLLRVPGIGAQSDYELKQIIAQAGELSKASSKADFRDRLQNIMGNLKAIGFDLKIPDLEQVTGMPSQTKSADRYTNPADAANAGSVPWDQNVTEDTMVGGANIGRTTRQPPTPPQRALNALKAYRNNPQARTAFDEIYGPGASDFYLQKYR